MKMAKSRGLTEEPEGGLRCTACFEMRLELVAEAAVKYGYDYFGSALTLSPKKNAQLINELGMEVQHLYDVSYLPSDFKKNKGYERSIEMCNDYHIFRQCYCGCVFAAMAQGIDFKQINQEAKDFYSNFKRNDSNLKFNPFKLGVVFYIVRLIKRIMARMAITNADRIPAILNLFLLLRFWIFIFHHFKQLAFNFKIKCGLLFAIIANAIIVIFCQFIILI